MKYILLLPALFLFACSNSQENETDFYSTGTTRITPDMEAWLSAPDPKPYGFDTAAAKLAMDSLSALYQRAGPVTLVDSDLRDKKCNRYVLTYQLKKDIKDSTTLAGMVSYLGNEWHLKNVMNPDNSCRSVPMTQVFLYEKKYKEFTGDWVAMISFVPNTPNGQAQIAMWHLPE